MQRWAREHPGAFRAQLSAAPLKLSRTMALRLHECSFRAQLSAAPLKPPDLAGAVHVFRTIPRSIERGPVEAVIAVHIMQSSRTFRAQLSAAPLKLMSGVAYTPPAGHSALN